MASFGAPQRGEDLKDTVELLYNHVSRMGKNLDHLIRNIDADNLAAELLSMITVGAGKTNIFSSQPAPPYYMGDIWLEIDEIKKCTTTKTSGLYAAGDWVTIIGPIVMLDIAQILTNKTLQNPVINAPAMTYKQSEHDYQGTTNTWTLTIGEAMSETLRAYNSSGEASIILPATNGKRYVIVNDTAHVVTVGSEQIAASKIAFVERIGGTYRRLTPDTPIDAPIV